MQKYQNFSYNIDTVIQTVVTQHLHVQGKSHVFATLRAESPSIFLEVNFSRNVEGDSAREVRFREVKLSCYVIADIGCICHVFADCSLKDLKKYITSRIVSLGRL